MNGWIEMAMENGANMIVRESAGTYIAAMDWKSGNGIAAGGPTISEAMDALNQALGDDAANEASEGGCV